MFPVTLHVYDLSQGMAKQMSQQLVGKQIDGIWHTGIVIYGKEFYFGGGISYDAPAATPFGQPTKVLQLGSTEIPESMFMEMLQDIAHKYTQATYDVFNHNCNNFTDEVAELVLGEGIPKDIVDLPKEFLATPLGKSLAPMMQGMQQNLMQSSNPLFDTNSGQPPIQPGASMGGPAMPGMGAPGMGAPGMGMPGMGAPGMGAPGMGGAGGSSNPLPFSGAPSQPPPSMGMPPMGGGMGGGSGGLPPGIPPGMIPPGMEGMAQQVMQNPQMMAQLQRMMQNGGGMPGMPGMPGAAAAAPAPPKLGEVCKITSLVQLQSIIKDYPGVIIDFWSTRCPPCMRFKPIYEAQARANQNSRIVFCSVETDQNRDSAMAFSVSSIPQFNFILNGAQHTKFVGADEGKFSSALGQIQAVLSGSASNHMSLTFKTFKPMNKLPSSFTATGQMDKMKQFVKNFATSQASEVSSTQNVMQWIEASFDPQSIPNAAVDELVQLAEVAEDKSKIALIDLFRLIVLKGPQAEYVMQRHWELIEICIIGYISAQNLQDTEARVMQNYHQMSLKLLANIFATEQGRAAMKDQEKACALIQFCSISFTSCNPKVKIHAGLVLFNYLLAFENEDKRSLQPQLVQATQAIEKILRDTSLSDKDVIVTLIMAQCRLMYKNHELTSWIEDSFQQLGQALRQIEARAAGMPPEVAFAVKDVMSMAKFQGDS